MEKRMRISLFVSLILILLSGSVNGNCRYRNDDFSEEIFSIFADFGCYKYTQKKFFIDGGLFRNISTCLFDAYKLPGIILDDKCEVFHHNNSRIQYLVRESFVNEVYFERWVDCCEDALQCCQKMQQSEQEDGSDLCPALWDGWTCFSSAPAGTTVEYPCPIYAYSGQGPKCTHFSQKQCFNNGTWSVQTNYATCAINQRLISRTTWHIIVLGLSVAVCLPALVIFFVYKNLHKFVLIRNLILAIVIRSILVIMSKKLIILDELVQEEDTVISKNGVPCRILSFFEKLTANAVFTCMLLEAIHLHRLLTNIFGCRKGPSGLNMMYYYVGGALVSILTAISWAIAMALANDQYCWVVTDGTDFQWINDTPRLLMLTINFILLLHIVLCLRKTFKYNPNERHKYIRRTAEVSLICLPLFGVPFLFVAVRPETKSCPWEQFYYFVSYALEGLQGIFVAILHCYINCEVRRTLRDSWWKLMGMNTVADQHPAPVIIQAESHLLP
ncbi:calcitonin gene-related peptide type 1 receptor-like isoform X2 [Phlebotomus papatasi]|uniref:calcitonin gene-related peptide type 1 receptor-like isoform X2 n=1 Tax=Phlebotomus papatasi TaxID=29031 RepID=UPI0024835E89|nr:calcitonin gene-related peptide type 1 receptor-like isoform X2 [Phlebotomus papatasi]